MNEIVSFTILNTNYFTVFKKIKDFIKEYEEYEVLSISHNIIKDIKLNRPNSRQYWGSCIIVYKKTINE